MHSHMTIHPAVSVRCTYSIIPVLINMPAVLMAIYAQGGILCDEEISIVRTVRYVTGKTIFPHRRMFPNKRTAFFLMTAIAGFVNCCFDQHSLTGGTVHIMAGRAINSAFPNREMRNPPHVFFFF